jgi:hypothetical protein
MTDERAAAADQLIRAHMKKGGLEKDQFTYYTLRERVRLGGGTLYLELLHPTSIASDDARPIAPIPWQHPWLEAKPHLHELLEGLELWFSKKNPELELARRRQVLAEEERKRLVASALADLEERKRRAAEERELMRARRWRELSPAARASARLQGTSAGQALDVSAFASALVEESEPNTDPPPSWKESA